MLSAILRSETAVSVSVQIMDAFVAMRHFIASNAQVFQRLEVIEHHQLEMSSHLTKNGNQIAEIFKRLDKENATPTQGIFFDGQIFDAYTFVSDLIRSAKKSIVLFDNYVDDTVLTMLDYPEGELSTDELNLMQRRSVRPKYLPPSTPKRLSSSYRLTLLNIMHSTSPLT